MGFGSKPLIACEDILGGSTRCEEAVGYETDVALGNRKSGNSAVILGTGPIGCWGVE